MGLFFVGSVYAATSLPPVSCNQHFSSVRKVERASALILVDPLPGMEARIRDRGLVPILIRTSEGVGSTQRLSPESKGTAVFDVNPSDVPSTITNIKAYAIRNNLYILGSIAEFETGAEETETFVAAFGTSANQRSFLRQLTPPTPDSREGDIKYSIETMTGTAQRTSDRPASNFHLVIGGWKRRDFGPFMASEWVPFEKFHKSDINFVEGLLEHAKITSGPTTLQFISRNNGDQKGGADLIRSSSRINPDTLKISYRVTTKVYDPVLLMIDSVFNPSRIAKLYNWDDGHYPTHGHSVIVDRPLLNGADRAFLSLETLPTLIDYNAEKIYLVGTRAQVERDVYFLADKLRSR